MDADQSRNRTVNEASRKGDNEPTLKDMHALLQSVVMHLENDMKMRLSATEESLENVHRFLNLEQQVSSLKTQLDALVTTNQQQKVIEEYRSKEYNILIY